MPRLLTCLALLCFLPPAGRGQQLAPNAPVDRPAELDKEMRDALNAVIAEAQKTYPAARERYLAGLGPRHPFFVTIRLHDVEARAVEQVFVYVVKIDSEQKTVTGRISSELTAVRAYKSGQTITFPETEVLDWTIAKPDGSEEGNYLGKFIDAYHEKQAKAAAQSAGKK